MFTIADEIEIHDEFLIEDLGVQEQYVYDIEVEDTHRFFANDILVHNSCYLDVTGIVSKLPPNTPKEQIVEFLDQFGNTKLQPVINDTCSSMAEYLNMYQNTMGAKREAIAERGLWTSKKRYALNVWDLEGTRFADPIIKVTGMETQKSSTPAKVRDALKAAIKIILNGTESDIRAYVESYREEFDQYPIDDISFPRGVNDIDKWLDASGTIKSGCPIHVRASIVHNLALEKFRLNNIRPIVGGDKIKFVYLKPSPYMSHVIGYSDSAPPEFELDKWVDRDVQYQKTFMAPLDAMLDAAKWGLHDAASLEDFFM